MKKQFLMTALILGLASAPVWAASGQSFSDLDSDGDGVLSQQEAEAVGISLDQADSDGDDQISESEYQQATGTSESGAAGDQTEEESEW